MVFSLGIKPRPFATQSFESSNGVGDRGDMYAILSHDRPFESDLSLLVVPWSCLGGPLRRKLGVFAWTHVGGSDSRLGQNKPSALGKREQNDEWRSVVRLHDGHFLPDFKAPAILSQPLTVTAVSARW
jgi:hypothetical protein